MTPETVARQTSLSIGFFRQEDWSGLLFLSSGDIPDPAMEPTSSALAGTMLSLKSIKSGLKVLCLRALHGSAESPGLCERGRRLSPSPWALSSGPEVPHTTLTCSMDFTFCCGFECEEYSQGSYALVVTESEAALPAPPE